MLPVTIEAELVKDTYSLARDARVFSQQLIHKIFIESGPPNDETDIHIVMTKESVLALAATLHQLANSVNRQPPS